MKALLAKIPRDRSLLLLLVPPIAVLAFMVNAQSQANYALPPPVPVGAPAATVPSTVPDLSSDATGAGADVEVAGASVSRTGVTRGTPTGSTGGSRSTGSGGAVTAQKQGASAENPASTTTVPEDQVGPEAAVSESPLALLLPLSALLMLAVGIFFALRRRSKPVVAKAMN